jgi:hypothetical protein
MDWQSTIEILENLSAQLTALELAVESYYQALQTELPGDSSGRSPGKPSGSSPIESARELSEPPLPRTQEAVWTAH